MGPRNNDNYATDAIVTKYPAFFEFMFLFFFQKIGVNRFCTVGGTRDTWLNNLVLFPNKTD